MSRINVEFKALHDIRFVKLAKKLGLKKPEYAIGAMIPIWFHCVEFGVYEINKEDLELLSGRKDFDQILISCGLAELQECGKIYISGTNGRIEWLANLRENGKYGALGGRPKKKIVNNNEDIKTHMGFKNNPMGFEKITPPVPVPVPTLKREHQNAKPLPRLRSPSDFECALSEQWLAHAKSITPKGKFDSKKFDQAIVKLKKHTSFDDIKLQSLFDWIRQDDFWRPNAISPAALFQKSKSNSDLKKIDQILVQFNKIPLYIEPQRKRNRLDD
jgi:hypothetical protein